MKKRIMRIFALIASVCSVLALALTLTACGNSDTYHSISLDLSEKPTEILSVELSANMYDQGGSPYYLETKEEGVKYIIITVTCAVGFEPDLTVTSNAASVKFEFNREEVEVIKENTVGRYICKIDNSILSGDETLKVTGGVKEGAYYPVTLTVYEGFATIIGEYETFSVTILDKNYTFADFNKEDTPTKVLIPHGEPFVLTVKIEGHTFTLHDDSRFICSPIWSHDSERLRFDDGLLFKLDDDTISYKMVIYGAGTIFVSLEALNTYYV